MIYRTHNLTGGVVVLQSKAGIHQFLKDRQRSVESKMRKAIKADSLIEEMTLILALQDEMLINRNRVGLRDWSLF